MQFNPAIKLSIEEFNRITQDRRLCNEEGEIEMRHWEGIMLGQLKLYAERMLGQSIPAVTEDNDHKADDDQPKTGEVIALDAFRNKQP